MIDIRLVIGFEWDDGNARKSEDKHGISQSQAEQVFGNEPLLLFDDVTHSIGEVRYHAYGRTDEGDLLQISFTMRHDDTVIRVISSRRMSRKERERYDEEL
ncbi:MAG: BrnT family toxin [Bosea sp. (in: a-proteobacteria)]